MFSFPDNPSANDTYSFGNKDWVYNGFAWDQLNVQTNSSILANVNSLSFELQGPGSTQPGTLAWNSSEECLDIYQTDDTICQVGLENYIRVHNMTGATLDNGTVVSFSGVEEPHVGHTEHLPLVEKFVANNSIDSLYVVGVITQPLANGASGRATNLGKVRGIDTTGSAVSETWVLGDLLWAHPTIPGAMTKVRPTAPNMAVSIAAVMHVHATEGELLVRPTVFPKTHYGRFSSTVNQTASQINTPIHVTWNNELISCDHVHIDGSNSANIVVSHQGLYEFDFSLEAVSSNSSRSNLWLWARKNDVDIAASARKKSIESNGGLITPSWAFVVSMNAGDTFQLMWAVDSLNISLTAPAATGFAPATPSALLTVKQVAL